MNIFPKSSFTRAREKAGRVPYHLPKRDQLSSFIKNLEEEYLNLYLSVVFSPVMISDYRQVLSLTKAQYSFYCT